MASNTFCASYISGDSVMLMTFNSAAECTNWNHDVAKIKDKMAWINTQWYPLLRVPLYQNEWIPMYKAFDQKWGSDYVPADIKSSLVDVMDLYP